MTRLRLTLQNGHRNAPNGQTGTGGELDLIDKVYYAMKAIIDSKYSDRIELSYDDASVLNGANANLFIALHFDGSTNPDYNGGFIDVAQQCTDDLLRRKIVCDYHADASWKFAQIVADHYFNPMGIRFAPEHRTVNSTQYYAFGLTGEDTKTFLIELGTLTNASDKAKLQDVNKIASLLMEGIVAYLSQYEPLFATGQAPPTNQTETDKLRQQLQEQTVLVEGLRQEKKDLAVKLAECQKKLDGLQGRHNGLVNGLNKLLNDYKT